MSLEINIEVAEIQKMYKETANKFNLLLLGEGGKGKTFLLRTAPKPVFIDSFDSKGTIGLQKWIDNGEIVVDNRYEKEDPYNPTAFKLWKETYKKRKESGFFNHFATYALDSVTTWSISIMNDILKKAKIAGGPPRWAHDYMPQKTLIGNYLSDLLTLPCNFIATGHLKLVEDPIGGKHMLRFLTTGDGMVIIPLKFSERWIMDTKETSKGVEYRILTQSTGTYSAKSSLAADGKLAQYEEPNIVNILKKVGLPFEDKPIFKPTQIKE